MAFRTYVTDSIKLLGENKVPNQRWYDIVHPSEELDFDPQEVIDDVVSRAGLVMT